MIYFHPFNRFKRLAWWRGRLSAAALFFCLLFLWPALALANVRISGFTDAGPDTWSGSGAVTWNDSLCVYNSAGDGFKVTATGSGTGGAFTLQGPQNLTYTVSFKSISLTAGSPQIFGSGAHRTLNDCGGTPNSPLEISISETNLSAAEPGEYQGTLTILLEPN